ncbi:MAG: hypothetical protein DRO40_04335 [Thermoprotei archaeon]|nr:MAG: hypothetical protein DRO40_04335 [Thermoprotei archaeon]
MKFLVAILGLLHLIGNVKDVLISANNIDCAEFSKKSQRFSYSYLEIYVVYCDKSLSEFEATYTVETNFDTTINAIKKYSSDLSSTFRNEKTSGMAIRKK